MKKMQLYMHKNLKMQLIYVINKQIRKQYEEANNNWKNSQNGANTSLSEEDIGEVIAGWTGIPLTKINETESDRLLNLEDTLHKRVIGQKKQ